MPLVGVVCGRDGQLRPFEECIRCHEYGPGPSCNAPVQLLKAMRDNHITRKHAHYSATMLLGCPRAIALLENYDYYEPLETAWNKHRGTLTHMMMEMDTTPKAGLMREQRLFKIVTINGIEFIVTGKPDEVDTERRILIDYKTAHTLPSPKVSHEAQFNIYAWLLDGGRIINEDGTPGAEVHVNIVAGGMHYLTFKTKEAWKKVAYPVWDDGEAEALVIARLAPLAAWKETGNLPSCWPYETFPGKWRCDCEKIQSQLDLRGIEVVG
jgi:hypothetical protein